MDYEDEDRLQLQHLAGSNVISQPPLYAPGGAEFLFVLSNKIIQVFSTNTGEHTHQLLGATAKLISMEIELQQKDILVACTSTGEVFRWKWSTGELLNKLQLKLADDEKLATFNLINYYGNSKTACAFITVKREEATRVQWFVVNTSNGERLNIVCSLKLSNTDPLVAVDTKNYNNIVIAQEGFVYFVNYESWKWKRLFNAYKVPVTVVRIHPTEELVATGDKVGKIFLWRQFMNQQTVKTSLYHWHHTEITSLAFSPSGVSFYSSGLEAVLVKWPINKPELKDFIPRMCSIIRHIAVADDNTQVAVCTADNGVQIVGNDNKLRCTLQEFTYIANDKTGKNKFPIGLRLNPRTNTLVLNGRTGHLQFYSVYSKHLLYNMDIIQQNQLSMETQKILYNIRVTKAAFNIDWMATGEVFNDEEHLPELRLKFWRYQEKTQSYTLNTNVELPHESGFRAIEFSNDYQVDNLLCATVGDDNIIKMWSLEESDNIYKKGKVWYCVAQTSYKNMPIESICFSQDGSLLAAGYGNTLCIYKADTLKLKAALTGSAGIDGCVLKAQVRVAKHTVNGSKNEYAEQRKKLMQLFTNLLENNDETLIKEIKKSLKIKKDTQSQSKPLDAISDKHKAQVYNKILQMHELNLFQKVLLYQKLNIAAKVYPQWQTKMAAYLRDTVSKTSLKEKHSKLHAQTHRLNMRDRFKAKYRLQQYTSRLRNYDAEITANLVPIMSVLNLNENTTQKQLTNGLNSSDEAVGVAKQKAQHSNADTTKTQGRVVPPVQTLAEITHVQFAAGEYAHLVIVCTATRVLIWNLLTLRLQSVLKLSVKHLAFDAQTNLVAAFTKSNDLHVFQPNVPLPIYQRRNLPNMYGAAWLPRRTPKQRSINLDWQAQSTLYFLTEDQEILYLGSADKSDIDAPPPITFTNAASSDSLQYSTFGTYATQKYSDKQSVTRQQCGPLVLGNTGKTAVKTLIEMSTHTMPPLSLLCDDFVKSLVKPAESSFTAEGEVKTSNDNHNDETHQRLNDPIYNTIGGGIGVSGSSALFMNGNAYSTHTDDGMAVDDDESTPSSDKRKTILIKTEELSEKQMKKTIKAPAISAETLLQRIAAQDVEVEF